MLDRLGAWPVRIGWLLFPLVTGSTFADALDAASRPVQMVASTGLWALWAAVVVATLVPTTVSLTVMRILAPGALVATAVAASAVVLSRVERDEALVLLNGDRPDPATDELWPLLAVAWAIVVVMAMFLPSIGEVFVNGSSYGDEIRMPLRVPGLLLLGPIPVAWLVTVLGGAAGPLLLAGRQWVLGGLALALGIPATLWGARILHMLSRRWTVFVPGGLVLHDPLALVHPVLLRRGTITWLGPAPADTGAVDLTGGALGLAVETRLQRPVPLLLAVGRGPWNRRKTNEVQEADALLFTPTRPGAFLRTARERRL